MGHGGARKGAGRPKGSKNRTQKVNVAAAKLAKRNTSPIDFWQAVLDDEEQPFSARHAAAKEMAPYVHRKLGPTPSPKPEDGPRRDPAEDDWERDLGERRPN